MLSRMLRSVGPRLSGFGPRLRTFLRWLREPWPAWLSVLVPVALLVSTWFWLPGSREFRVRSAGLGLTLVGAFLVARGIVQMQRRFARPDLPARFRLWWRRRPPLFLRPKGISITLSPASVGFSATAMGTLSIAPRPPRERDVSERLSALESLVSIVQGDVESIRAEHAAEISTLRAETEKERKAREAALAKIQKEFEDVSVGGMDVELMGVAWFLAGEILTTLPGEIAGGLSAILGGAP